MRRSHSRVLDMIQDKYPTYHPLLALADIAHDPEASLDQQITCNKTIAEYVEPKLKQIDVRGALEQPKVVVTLFDDEYEVIEDMTSPLNNTRVDNILLDYASE